MAYNDPEKRKAYLAEYNKKNRERIKAQRKSYREKNREKILAEDRKRRQKNKDKIREQKKVYSSTPYARSLANARNKKYREKNKDAILLRESQRRNRDREKIRERGRVWSRKNKSKVILVTRERRAKKKKCSISLTAHEKEQISFLEERRSILSKETGKQYHIDHILPVNHGGIHHPINLRILEGSKNVAKGHRIIPEAVALIPDHYKLYLERVGIERAQEFLFQLKDGLGVEVLLDSLGNITYNKKPTLEDLFE